MIPRGFYGMLDTGLLHSDAALIEGWDLLRSAGVGAIQLRAKERSPEERLRLGRSLLERHRSRVAPGPVQLFVNDDVPVARALASEAPPGMTLGVHLGQGDGPDPEHLPFGRSTHTLAQVRASGRASYLGFGPVFGTRTKATGYAPRGVALLQRAVATASVPVVAIGGIDVASLGLVRASGVHAWTCISALWGAPDPARALAELQHVP